MTRLAALVPMVLLALCACSSPGPDTISASSPGATASARVTSTPNAVCGRVMQIVQTASRSAVAALTPAIRAGDPQKLAAAQSKAQAYYRQAADDLRAEAPKARDAGLKQRINAAAAYFEKAGRTTQTNAADDSLAKLAEACS